jgi:hypothetical protein
LLRGKITSAGDIGSHLILKESLCEATKASLEESLGCRAPRCSKGTTKLYFEIEPIHLKSALKATQAIIDCMADADAKLFLRFNIPQLLSIFVSLTKIKYLDFIKVLKYYTAYPLAFFLKNDLPSKPEGLPSGSYPFCGNSAIRRWWKERMFSGKHHYDRNLQLFWTLLQGVKRACEFAGSDFVHMSMLKHKDTLITPDTTNFFEIRAQKYREEFLAFFKCFHPNIDKKYELSNSACWEKKRSDGGSRARVLDIVNDVYCIAHRNLIRNRIGTVLHKMCEVSPGKVQELRGVRTPAAYDHDLVSMIELQPKAMVAAILEPLKVRLITKGPAVNYFLSKPYQKSLFKYLQSFPQFELTGDPLREDHLYRMLDRENKFAEKTGMEFTHFVSGDYSAATDNLKIMYTKMGLWASDNSDVPLPYFKALETTLFEHEIHYPKDFVIQSFKQGSGQLMGSPLSFPFLCIANMVAYKISLERHLGTAIKGFRGLPCLVNGDDILFRTNPEHYELWKKEVASIGFDLSVGKNYIHDTVLTINSTCYTFRKDRFNKVDFCNFGLLSGTSKKGASRGEVRDKAIDLCDAYTQSVGGAMNKPLAHAKFMTRNKEDLIKITHRGRYNLFLPREVGGLGLPIFEGINYHVTRFQACVAKLIKKTLDFNLVGFKTDLKSECVVKRETSNQKKLMVGFGPLRESERIYNKDTVTEINGDYLSDSVVKFFTKIPEKYNPKELFPFALRPKDMEFEFGIRRLVVNYNPDVIQSEAQATDYIRLWD